MSNDDEAVIEGHGEWISALDAVHLLAGAFHGDEAAKRTILSRLQDEALEGCAEIVLQEADIGRLDFDELAWGEHKKNRHPNQHDRVFLQRTKADGWRPRVPANFFSSADGWAIDFEMTSWTEGRFLARRPTGFVHPHFHLRGPDVLTRRLVSGLMFRERDIKRMLNREDDLKGAAESRGRKRGPKPKETWPDWVAEVALMVHASEIKIGASTEGLIERIADRLAVKGIEAPSRSRTYDAAAAVLKAINAADEL